MDFHHSDVGNETEKDRKKCKKVIQRIIKAKKCNYQFQYMIKYLGKGVKGAFRKLHITNEDKQIVKTINKREDIEEAIIIYNRNHLKQAHNMSIYKDKIYHQLSNDQIRDKILK